MKNYLKMAVEEFMKDNGLKVGDEFVIMDDAYNPYRFDDSSRLLDCDNTVMSPNGFKFTKLLTGQLDFKVIWMPKPCEKYYYLGCSRLNIQTDVYHAKSQIDNERVSVNNFFKTYEEAECARNKIIKLLEEIKNDG